MSQSFVLDSSFLFTETNSKIGLLRDNMYSLINELEIWLNNILNQTRKESLIRKVSCEICNIKDILEGHHIAGRKHDHRQISACKICHKWLSDRQKTWDRRWEKENLSENLRNAFFLLGLQDILVLKSKKTGNPLYEHLGYSFTEIISELLKRG